MIRRWAGAERVSKKEAEHGSMEATLPCRHMTARVLRQNSSAILAIQLIGKEGSATYM